MPEIEWRETQPPHDRVILAEFKVGTLSVVVWGGDPLGIPNWYLLDKSGGFNCDPLRWSPISISTVTRTSIGFCQNFTASNWNEFAVNLRTGEIKCL